MGFNKEEYDSTKSLINFGSEIAGSAAGAAIGFLFGGPMGAAIGGTSTQLIKKGIIEVGKDFAERFLSEREKIRIGGVIAYATIKINDKIAEGKMPRDDGFFEDASNGHTAYIEIPIQERPAAQEILDGVLLAAQREYEEKKIPFLGNLLANIAFTPGIDKDLANLLIRLGRDLSFRQLCLTYLFKNKEIKFPKHLDIMSYRLWSLVQDIYSLMSQNLLNYPSSFIRDYSIKSGESELQDSVTTETFPIFPIKPRELELQGIGYMLYDQMGLKDINKADIDAVNFILQNSSLLAPREKAWLRYPPESPHRNVLWAVASYPGEIKRSELGLQMRMKEEEIETILLELKSAGLIKIDAFGIITLI